MRDGLDWPAEMRRKQNEFASIFSAVPNVVIFGVFCFVHFCALAFICSVIFFGMSSSTFYIMVPFFAPTSVFQSYAF